MNIEDLKRSAAETIQAIEVMKGELKDLEAGALKFCKVETGTRVTRASTRNKGKLEEAEVRDITASFDTDGRITYAFYGRLIKADGELSTKMMRLWRHGNWKLVNGGVLHEYENI